MRKAQMAEFILALFTSRERAASTIGDLMENASQRSAWWFWANVCRTALSLFWDSFTVEPFSLAGISFRGLILNLCLHLASFVCVLFIAIPLGLITGMHSIPRFSWVIQLVGGIAMLAVQFQTGRWIARHARDREMAVAAAFLIVSRITMPIVGEMLFSGRWSAIITSGASNVQSQEISFALSMMINLVATVALLSGAVWVRRSHIKGATQ